MALTGGCLCGALRFEVDGPLRMKGLCLCRTCQVVSGGAGNLFAGVEAQGFRYTKGAPATYRRPEEDAPTREFCGACGVHIGARSPRLAGVVILKIGVLDDPSAFEGPDVVIWTDHGHAFHATPEGVRSFPGFPGRG